jgi:hypothetical protein
MSTEPEVSTNQDLKALLEENLKLTRAIYTLAEKTRRHIFWGEVFGVLRTLIIVVPLILAYFYLQPMLQQAIGAYQELLGVSADAGNTNQSLLDQLRGLQKVGKINIQDFLK